MERSHRSTRRRWRFCGNADRGTMDCTRQRYTPVFSQLCHGGSRMRRTYVGARVLCLAVPLLFRCSGVSLLLNYSASTGWYSRPSANPDSPTAVTVAEHTVTGLDIQAVDPADENLEIEVVDVLRGLGHGVIYAAEAASGEPDISLLGMAAEQGRVLITNHKDFGALCPADRLSPRREPQRRAGGAGQARHRVRRAAERPRREGPSPFRLRSPRRPPREERRRAAGHPPGPAASGQWRVPNGIARELIRRLVPTKNAALWQANTVGSIRQRLAAHTAF